MAHIQSVKLDPDPLVVGKSVTLTVTVDDPSAIASVKAYDPRGYELRLKKTGEGDDAVFTYTDTVPYDATSGVYYGTIVLTDNSGNTERKGIEFRVA